MSKTDKTPVECKAINGKKTHLAVLKLVKRIYTAFEQKNYKQLKKLQKTLAQSWCLQLWIKKKLHQSKLKTQSLKAIFDLIQAQPQYVLKIETYTKTESKSLWQRILPVLLDVALGKINLLRNPKIASVIARFARNLTKCYRSKPTSTKGLIKQPLVVKSGEEIVIFSEAIAPLKECQQTLIDWLNVWGITIKYSEISSTHSFDFAGFSIRQSQVGNKVKTIIRPSPVTILTHYRSLANCCDQLKGTKQIDLISKLNLIIQKWSCNYLSWCCQKLLRKLDYLLAKKLQQWAIRRHPRKGKQWVKNKYWHQVKGDKWRFSSEEIYVEKHFCAKVNPNTIH